MKEVLRPDLGLRREIDLCQPPCRRLGKHVVQVETGRGLDGRPDLRRRPAPPQGEEVEGEVPVRLVTRGLLYGHEIRRPSAEERIEPKRDVPESLEEVDTLLAAEIGEAVQPVAPGPHRDFIGPARRERHRDRKALVLGHRAVTIGRAGDDAAEAGSPLLAFAPVSGDLRPCDRRKVVEGIDLAVRMRQRRARLDAAILEREDALVAPVSPERAAAIDPDGEQPSQLGRRQLREARLVSRRVHDHLAAAECGRCGAVGSRWLGRLAGERGGSGSRDGCVVGEGELEPARADRARDVGRLSLLRVVRANVALRGDNDPFVGEQVEAPVDLTRTPIETPEAG